MDEKLFIAYARFEAKLKEYERARAIYKYALDRMPRSKSAVLHKHYTTFEKQYGDREGVEDVVLAKRRVMYEEQVKDNPRNYDSWFDYVRLEESSPSSTPERVRDVYERAIAQVPPSQEKRHWRRYIYLWVFYALYEELQAKDVERAAQVYTEALKLVPHKKFTFAKLWILKTQFHLRQGNLSQARKTMGMAIGLCPKNKLYRAYIDMERKLYEFLRCRTLYEKWIEWDSSNCNAWIEFSRLEQGLDDIPRARAIFELAVTQPVLDMPELLWKAYIDFEEERAEEPEEFDRPRDLYERLLQKTDHVKVWISYAQFEINIPDFANPESEAVAPASITRARTVFERAHKVYKDKEMKEERVALLNAWKSFEDTHGSEEDREKIAKQMPRRVKKRRRLDDDSFEEYMDYVFPADDEGSAKMSKLMAMAQKWKKEQEANGGGDA
jgi:crooked neck